mgnify:CR=1 FL=1
MPLSRTRKNFKNAFNQTRDSVLLPEMDFRLGHVERVITSQADIMDILDNPKIKTADVSQVIQLTPRKSLLPGKKKRLHAQPLLRGINDSVTRGDAVLYVNIEGILFYLGPINTTNNPNYTPDHTLRKSNRGTGKGKLFSGYYDDEHGYNSYYPKTGISKLSKIEALDPSPYMPIYESKHTDLVLEGRHGNSIRVGSKGKFPVITISNGRTSGYESLSDGSHFSMFSAGPLTKHFLSEPDQRLNPIPFKLACDDDYWMTPEQNPRGIKINYGNNIKSEVEPENEFNVNYVKHQIVMFSNRIIFDAHDEDLTMSAFRNINLGAGGNFTISNKGFSVIETKNIYIGREAKARKEPLVLGNELKKLLIDMMKLLENACAITPGGPVPLVDKTGTPLGLTKLPITETNDDGQPITKALRSITDILQELETPYSPDVSGDGSDAGTVPFGDRSSGGPNFLSQYHFVETNHRS